MSSVTVGEATDTRLLVLALGLLVGFVIGFVLLLSNLPVESGSASGSGELADHGGDRFDFYTELPGEEGSAFVPVRTVASQTAIVEPVTRVAPAPAPSHSARNVAVENTAAIPSSALGQESYYLQAGSFSDSGDAELARAAVLLVGLDAFIVTREDHDGARGHRVRIGPFFDASRLTTAKQRLRANNIPYEIIRVTG